MTKRELLNLIASSLETARRARTFLDAAAVNADPSHNAELMHSLHQAQEDMDRASGKLMILTGALVDIGDAVSGRYPSDEEKKEGKAA